jgi:hypothetical protein
MRETSFAVCGNVKTTLTIDGMRKESKNKLKGTLVVPLGLAITLVPFSMVIGWNLLTLILFWFVLTPGLATYLPAMLSNNRNHLFESQVGLIIFYGIMVFMIYDHYKTDYFQIMILSCLVNLVVVSAIHWVRRPARVQHKF